MGLIWLAALAAIMSPAGDAPPRTGYAVPSQAGLLIVYELHIDATLPPPDALVVTDPDTGKTLKRFDFDELARRSAEFGGSRIVYVEIALAGQTVPSRLTNRLSTASSDVIELPVRIDRRPLVVLAAPLKGGPWVAVHSPDWARGHRRVMRPGMTIPGRFAIDFVGVDEAGRTTRGATDVPADATGYGAPVLAGAPATVAFVRDDMAEAESISSNPAHALADSAGNYVALRLIDGRHVFYEHLKPGSIRVRVGQQVQAGDMIGALGFTGDSTGPHLHMHVADGADPLLAEGLPFVIIGYDEIGRYADLSSMGSRRWAADGKRRRTVQWPGSNTVVRFDDGD